MTSMKVRRLSSGATASVVYHDLFDYPLTQKELIKWTAGTKVLLIAYHVSRVGQSRGYYYLKGKRGLVSKRLQNEKTSRKKLKLAKDAAEVIAKIPTVKMVGVTGALAMKNAKRDSDIDLLIICQKGFLWTTRLITYLVLRIKNYELRVPKDKDEKDKLCLNIWMDEGDLAWGQKNIYTAHEIAQIVPLINKDKTYEKFIWENKWIKKYWPRAITRSSMKQVVSGKGETRRISPILHATFYFLQLFEYQAYLFQRLYMKSKLTNEVITPNRAIFHPRDLSSEVLKKFKKWR